VKATAVWLTIIVAAVGPAGAATYYVDSEDGCDDPAWNGGPTDPWATLTYALSRVSGENTFLCRGVFREDVRVAYEEPRSAFAANPDAVLEGSIEGEHEVGIDVTGFDVYGYVAGGPLGRVDVTDSHFINPSGGALGINHYYGCARAEGSLFENCASVCGASNWEFGRMDFYDCEIKDCGRGMSVMGEGSAYFANCRFTNVDGKAFGGYFYGEGATFTGCEFYDCGTGIDLEGYGPYHGYWATIANCEFRGNGQAIQIVKEGSFADVNIVGSRFIENNGPGISLEGITIKLRGNVVTGNDGHGVYIAGGDPDLGTPAEPGGNTFAGNASGYDVYNASAENIFAVGNTWDAQSENEMEGKTWQEINVTRIHDHWDDPSVGYVMWCDPVSVAPASLGRIKASFGEGAPAPAQAPKTAETGE
jgi:hypothetical protein